MDQNARPRYGDYFVLETASGDWVIGREMVRFLERELDRWPRRRWVTFVDLAGARVRLRSDLIRAVRQSSPEIRAEWQRFVSERQREEREASADRDGD